MTTDTSAGSVLEKKLAQMAAIEEEIAQLRKAERKEALGKVRKLISDHQLGPSDLGYLTEEDVAKRVEQQIEARLAERARSDRRCVVKAKYLGPNGEKWAGRGLKPAWLSKFEAEGGNITDLLIKKVAS